MKFDTCNTLQNLLANFVLIGRVSNYVFVLLALENILKNITKEKTFKRLEMIKQKHSKVKVIKHTKLEIQPYLLPNGLEITKDITQLIFKLRCRETKVKMNLQGLYDSHQCEICMK